MSDEFEIEAKEGAGSLLNPPLGLAGWMAALGLWGLSLGFLNILGMAFPGELQISWAGFLSVGLFGDGVVSNTGFHPISDSIFFIGCAAISGIGLRALNDSDVGVDGWAKGLIFNDTWPALFTFDNGWERSIGAWSMLIGLIFYLWWGFTYTGWVDPGVYSVFVALFAFGYAMASISDHVDATVPKE